MKNIYHVYWSIQDWFNQSSNYRVMINLTDSQIHELEQELFLVVPCSYLIKRFKQLKGIK
jgi:hypothetical protein